MTTHPFDNMRADHEGRTAVDDTLTPVTAWLRLRGHSREANSLQHMLSLVLASGGYEVVAPGLSALLMWARREDTDPLLVRAGDMVRVVRNDGLPFTGVWKRSRTGAPLVQCDETGDDRPVNLATHTVELVHLDRTARPDTFRAALWTAAAIVRSAWLERSELAKSPIASPAEPPLDDELARLEAAEHAQFLKQRERERLCACGRVAGVRVVAWAPVEDVEMGELDEDGVRWQDPTEYGSETACSHGCATVWARKFKTEAVLGSNVELRFRVELWTYQPQFDEVPDTLARARAAAENAYNKLNVACAAHVLSAHEGGHVVAGVVGAMVDDVKPDIVELLDAVLMLDGPNATRE